MTKPFIEIDAKDFILHPFEINKPEDYEFPADFPNCCESHKSNLKTLEKFLEKFPNCCDNHLAIYKKFNFDKNVLYKDLPLRILKTAAYTAHQITKAIDKDDWLEDITEYFELALRSLGQPAVGCHIYIELVELFIKNKETNISNEKKKIILNYFTEQNNYTPAKEKTDMNLLFGIYEKWLNFFPFELVFFNQLKPQLSKTLPFVKGEFKTNRYLGQVSFQMVTPTELVDSLYQRTIYILSLVDTVELVKQDKIDNAEKLKIDFINQTHQHKQRMLINTFTKGEGKYIKTIKKWLENEKEYFSSITPIVSQKGLPSVAKKELTGYFQIKDSATRHHKAQSLSDKLIAKNYIHKDCKANFINAFIGTKPKDKVNWTGAFGDLKSFIKYCNAEKLFEDNIDVWVITSEVFTFKQVNIPSKKIKDTKVTNNDYNIKKLVKSIF